MNLLRKIRWLWQRRKLDAEMAEEMRLHRELQTEKNMAAGMNAEEARYAAQRAFGGVEQIKERCREQRGWAGVASLVRDLRLAGRSLRRAPIFSLAVIATLALCIGPNTALLTMLYALVLKPQPFHEPDRLVHIYNGLDKLTGGNNRFESSVPQYRDFKAGADLFDDFAIMRYAGSTLEEGGATERVMGMRVKAGFFDFLGVQPLLGRFGRPDEDVIGRDRVLVLTQSFWESRFGADVNVVGKVVRMGGEGWTVIGVAPRRVEGLNRSTQFFKPYEAVTTEEDQRVRYGGKTILFGRLKPGGTREAALEQLRAIEGRYINEQALPATRTYMEKGGHRIGMEKMGAEVADAVRTPLTILQVCAGCVLLIGAVNAMNLMLARANAKQPEFAIRHALGAGWGALARQLVAESVLLTTVATMLGVGLAWACLQGSNAYLPWIAGTAGAVALEPVTIAVAAGLALVLAILVGVIPFVLMWRRGLSLGAARTASGGGGARRFGALLVVGQVMIALILLVGAALLLRSFERVLAIDLGFNAQNLVQGRLAVPKGYEKAEQNVGLQRRILVSLHEIPGVEHAALTFDYALSANFRLMPFVRRGQPVASDENRPMIGLDPVSPEFFDTLQATLLEGRIFAEADDGRNGSVVVVDDLFARRYFPDQSAVGHEIVLGGVQPLPDGTPWTRIIGVVRRAQLTGREGRDGIPIVFVPMMQQPALGFSIVVRSPRPTAALVADIRRKLHTIEPAMPLYGIATIAEGLDSMMTFRRGVTWLIVSFAGLALMLAAVGLYGVLAYDVSQRTREIGIRSAIGATRRQIMGMVLWQGIVKTAIGLGLGLVGAAYLTRFLRAWLFDIGPFDPLAFGVVGLLLLAVSLLASWLPARRAAKVDPMVALRCE